MVIDDDLPLIGGQVKSSQVKERPGRAVAPQSPLLAVPNVTAQCPPINGQRTNFILFDVVLL